MLPAVERLCADYGTPLLPASVEAAREVERGDQSLEGDALRTPQVTTCHGAFSRQCVARPKS